MTNETLPPEATEEHNTNASSVSERKREANRKNAQRSTGPRTEVGKSRSRRNAVKHGFLTKVIPITDLENRELLEAFSEELIKTTQPEGPLERLQIDLIVQAYWKLRRLQVAENAAIEVEIIRAVESWKKDEPYALEDLDWESKLAAVSKSIELHGYADVAAVAGLRELVSYGQRTAFEQANQRARAAAAKKAGDSSRLREEEFRKAQSDLSRIVEEWKIIAKGVDSFVQHATQRVRLPFLLQQLVPRPSSETLLRYQTATLNQLYRAMAELERLQRQRRGDVVPPPLKLTT